MIDIYEVDKVSAIIQQQFPDFKIYEIDMVGAGNDCVAYQINRDYIFKFPKHQRASDNLLNEVRILDEIQNKLPLPIPKVVFRGYPSEYFEMNFAGYTKTDGAVLTPNLLRSLPPAFQEQVAADLANFLRVLHNIEGSQHRRDLMIDLREKYEKDYREIKDLVASELEYEQQQKVDGFYEDLLNDDDYFSYKACLVHNDFSSDHILYDLKNNRVCGIIDFGDVAISDPDNDFIMLLEEDEEFGLEFTLKVLNYYKHTNIDLLLKKFYMREKYWVFEKILYGREYGDDDLHKEGMNEIDLTLT